MAALAAEREGSSVTQGSSRSCRVPAGPGRMISSFPALDPSGESTIAANRRRFGDVSTDRGHQVVGHLAWGPSVSPSSRRFVHPSRPSCSSPVLESSWTWSVDRCSWAKACSAVAAKTSPAHGGTIGTLSLGNRKSARVDESYDQLVDCERLPLGDLLHQLGKWNEQRHADRTASLRRQHDAQHDR